MADRVVMVTGGGRGIGRAACVRFAQSGDRIMAVARTRTELEETRRLVLACGGTCELSCADVTVEEEVGAAVQDALDAFGRVDVLVNAAGVAPLGAIEELDADVFDTILSVNVRGVFLACRGVWPHMVKQGGGVIVNLSSVASEDPFPGFAAYGASKAWVNAWTRGLAEEGRPKNISVFSIAPGAVETKMLRDAFPDYPKKATMAPGDVAEMIHTLASPGCRYATGRTIVFRK